MEMRPGVMTLVWAEVAAEATIRQRIALGLLGDAAVRKAKANASQQKHPYGTRTPARPGNGPAVISGTLVGSLTRTKVSMDSTGWYTNVGTAPGKTPPYGKTASSLYGLYLETAMLRNGTGFPFLVPAATQVGQTLAKPIFTVLFGKGWRVA